MRARWAARRARCEDAIVADRAMGTTRGTRRGVHRRRRKKKKGAKEKSMPPARRSARPTRGRAATRLIEETERARPTPRRRPTSGAKWRGASKCPKPDARDQCSQPCPIFKKFPIKNSNDTTIGQKKFCARTSGSPGNGVSGGRRLLQKHSKTFAALFPDDPDLHPKGVHLTTSTNLVGAMTKVDLLRPSNSSAAQVTRAINDLDEKKRKLVRQADRLVAKARRENGLARRGRNRGPARP